MAARAGARLLGSGCIGGRNAVMAGIDTGTRTKQQLKKARVALANTHTNGSIDTLHAYFHNLDMNPDVAGIRDAWDTWENYLALLHQARG